MEKVGDGVKSRFTNLFYQVGDDDLDRDFRVALGSGKSDKMPTGRDDNDSERENDGIAPGKRPEYWFERADIRSRENYKRSIQNESYLKRLDYRTVWIMRILTGLTVYLLGALVLQLVGL